MEQEPIRTEEYKGHLIKIYQDVNSESPREWDNIGTMACYHRRYNLGDKHEKTNDAEKFKEWLDENKDDLIILPLYLYDHSGITIMTKPFSDYWDSGLLGYIYVSKKKAMEEMGWSNLDYEKVEKIKEILELEVKTYDQFLTGEVYGFSIEDDIINDSCWGYFGIDNAISAGKESVDYGIKKYEEDIKEAIKNHKKEVNELSKIGLGGYILLSEE